MKHKTVNTPPIPEAAVKLDAEIRCLMSRLKKTKYVCGYLFKEIENKHLQLRNLMIRHFSDAGASSKDLSKQFQLSETRICQIINMKN